MSNFEDTFKELLARYSRKVYRNDIAEILSYEQETRSGGYCESCYYDEIVVEVRYLSTSGETKRFDIYGDMGELIRDLSDFEKEELGQ